MAGYAAGDLSGWHRGREGAADAFGRNRLIAIPVRYNGGGQMIAGIFKALLTPVLLGLGLAMLIRLFAGRRAH